MRRIKGLDQPGEKKKDGENNEPNHSGGNPESKDCTRVPLKRVFYDAPSLPNGIPAMAFTLEALSDALIFR